jgi:hypothetical protein
MIAERTRVTQNAANPMVTRATMFPASIAVAAIAKAALLLTFPEGSGLLGRFLLSKSKSKKSLKTMPDT